jgi:hypothetical protein
MLLENISVPGSDESLSRRKLLRGIGAAAGAAMLAPDLARAQPNALDPVAPPSTISNPPRDFSASGAPTTYFTDPDVLTIDPSFDGLRQPNAAIQRRYRAHDPSFQFSKDSAMLRTARMRRCHEVLS